jgi:hypothetical protein
MHLRGIIQTAALQDHPTNGDQVEMVLKLQGVGPGQPRTIVVPFDVLVQDEALEPEAIARRAFEAEVVQAEDQRWMVAKINFASRILREPD